MSPLKRLLFAGIKFLIRRFKSNGFYLNELLSVFVVSRDENVDFVTCYFKMMVWVRSFTKVVKFINIDTVFLHFMKSRFVERRKLSITLTRKSSTLNKSRTIYFVSRIKITDNFNSVVKVKWKDHNKNVCIYKSKWLEKWMKTVTVIWSNSLSSSERDFCCLVYHVSLYVLDFRLRSVVAQLITLEISYYKYL